MGCWLGLCILGGDDVAQWRTPFCIYGVEVLKMEDKLSREMEEGSCVETRKERCRSLDSVPVGPTPPFVIEA